MALSSLEVAINAYSAVLEFISVPTLLQPSNHCSAILSEQQNCLWTLPGFGLFKINSDAAWDPVSLKCGLAVLARNSSGALIGGMSLQSVASSAIAAEAKAIELGIQGKQAC